VRRRIFNFAAAVSLALCLGTVGLWVRSYQAKIQIVQIIYNPTTARYGQNWILNSEGVLMAGGLRETLPPRAQSELKGRTISPFIVWTNAPVPQTALERLGVYVHVDHIPQFGSKSTKFRFGVRHWILVSLLAFLPVRWSVGKIKRHQYCDGDCCTSCAYSLKGNVSGVCPECGTPVVGKAGVRA
jgi:hypothetical protein